MLIEVTIGWTKSDMDNGYSSFMGYQPGAEQHVEVIGLQSDGKGTGIFAAAPTLEAVEQIAEAVFDATNNPGEVSGLSAEIRAAIAANGYRGEGAHYSLSTGDTVTVGKITVECQSLGWGQISLGELTV